MFSVTPTYFLVDESKFFIPDSLQRKHPIFAITLVQLEEFTTVETSLRRLVSAISLSKAFTTNKALQKQKDEFTIKGFHHNKDKSFIRKKMYSFLDTLDFHAYIFFTELDMEKETHIPTLYNSLVSHALVRRAVKPHIHDVHLFIERPTWGIDRVREEAAALSKPIHIELFKKEECFSLAIADYVLGIFSRSLTITPDGNLEMKEPTDLVERLQFDFHFNLNLGENTAVLRQSSNLLF